jgi:hypothetical protein
MADLAAAVAIIPGSLGFRWQAVLLGATPILCALGCLIAFLASPVGNRSQNALIRGIGRIPVIGRYLVYVGVVCGVVLLEALCLNWLASSSIQSFRLSGDVSPSSESPMRIRQAVGEGVTFRWRGDETRIFFLKEKRAAVLHAIQDEHIQPEE